MTVAKKAFAIIGTVASIAAVIPGPQQPFFAAAAIAANIGGSLIKAKPLTRSLVGSITEFSYNPNAGTPCIAGRSFFAGIPIHRDGYPANASPTPNHYLTYAIEYSGAGPIGGFEQWLVDKEPVAFAGGAATGKFAGYMWLATSNGAVPQAAALAPPAAGMEGWDATSKASGHAQALWTLLFDDKDRDARLYAQGEPEPGAVVNGIFGYDPRKDSTYPGGAGAHRWADPSDTAGHAAARATWQWTDDPFVTGLNYALGYWHRDPDVPGSTFQKIGGAGLPIAGIDVPAYVEGANVCLANAWKLGGVFSLKDDKWATLKAMLAAGGGEPMMLGGKLSCIVSGPKVSLATIGEDQIVGDTVTPGVTSRRGRPNSYVPLYTSEDHDWEQIPAKPVTNAAYVAAEGGMRQEELPFLFVQNAKQASQLAYYKMANKRELPIATKLKPRWLGYKPGDCVTIDWPSIGHPARKVVVQHRSIDAAAKGGAVAVDMDLLTETDAKHPAALALDPVPPAVPVLTSTDLRSMPTPLAGDWTVTGATLTSTGGSIPVLVASGGATNGNAAHVLFEYRVLGVSGWTIQAVADASAVKQEFPTVTPGTQYEVAISYISRSGVVSPRRVYGPVTAGSLVAGVAQAVEWDNVQNGGGNRPEDKATNDRSGEVNTNYSPAYYRDNWAKRTRGEKKQRTTIAGPGASTNAWLSTWAPGPSHADGACVQWFTGIDDNIKAVRHSSGVYPTETWGAWQASFGEQRLPYFGADITETSGGALATLANFKTGLGVASGFVGQGVLASLNSLAYGGAYLSGFGALAGDAYLQFGSSKLRRSDGTTTASDGDYRTSLGVASGFTGQGALATKNAAVWATDFSSMPGWASSTVDFNNIPRLRASYIAKDDASSQLQTYWPATTNSDRTSNATAAGFTGQGSLATKNAAVWATDFSSMPGWASSTVDFNNIPRLRASYIAKDDASSQLQTYWPATTNSDRTSNATAAGFTGQGSLATQNSLAYGGAYLTGFGGLAARGDVYFGSAYVLESSGGSQATLSNFKTGLGVASGFTGQGSMATLNSAAYGSAYLTGFGGLAARGDVYFGSAYVLESSGGSQATLSNFKTGLGVASGFTGQGAFASLSQTELNNASRFSDAGRVGKLATTGRFNDTRGLTTQAQLNSLNRFEVAPTYTVGGSNITVNIPASNAKISSPSGATTLSYGATSGTVAFSANWYAYYIDAAAAGNATPTLYLTTNKDDLLHPDKVLVARGTAPDSGGGGGSVPPGGGGGGGGSTP